MERPFNTFCLKRKIYSHVGIFSLVQNIVAYIKIGLQVNTSKTKYHVFTTRKVTLSGALAVKPQTFGRAYVFRYVGVLVRTENIVTREIQAGLKAGIRRSYALQAAEVTKNFKRS
jgi:hypothetical protein